MLDETAMQGIEAVITGMAGDTGQGPCSRDEQVFGVFQAGLINEAGRSGAGFLLEVAGEAALAHMDPCGHDRATPVGSRIADDVIE